METIILYEYSDLSPQAQEAAIQAVRQAEMPSDWWMPLFASLSEAGADIVAVDVNKADLHIEFDANLDTVASNIIERNVS